MAPLVSILIPSYNAEEWIAESITSALAQTWSPIEVIVVDDGSSDNTVAVAESIQSPHLRVIAAPHGGAAATRNRALKEAKGDFIQYLDADDLLANDKIERQVALLSQPGNENCISSSEWARFRSSISEAVFEPQELWKDSSAVDWFTRCWELHGMMLPAAWLVPKQVADQAGPWDESLSLNDDGEYFCRLLFASEGIVFCEGARSYYRSFLDNSLSGAKSPQALESLLSSLEKSAAVLLSHEDSARTRAACANAIQHFIYSSYPQVPELRKRAEALVAEHGGSDFKPLGGAKFQLLSRLFGWKLATRIQRAAKF